ncbi:MAG TPA: hypothetical protein PLG52_00675 [Anaerolineales bacterium]|nr:hypothetical protein [Anaerolineales bacterium]
MKTKKWLWWTLTILLTLVVLTGVAIAGFRFGAMHSATLTAEGTSAFAFHHGHDFSGNMTHEGFGMMRGSERGHGFGGRGGFGFFGPLFGLIQLAVFGGLVWLAFSLIKRSGWRLVNVNNSQAAAPAPDVAPEAAEVQVESEEKKDEA